MKKNILEIKKYWDERAQSFVADPRRTTTNDYWLRLVEIREIKRALAQIKKKKKILDIGCGDGFSTINIAKSFSSCNFIGGDYSENMIKNAKILLKKMRVTPPNIKFQVLDVLDMSVLNNKFDVIISDRCIINLPDRKLQKRAMQEIWRYLKKNGYYIMVEDFVEGHNVMNKLRKKLGLKEIPIRWHNNFLDERIINDFITKYFKIITRKNISSIYYLITRVVYSKICQNENREPDYDDPLYKIAYEIDEYAGNYGPVNLLVLKKE